MRPRWRLQWENEVFRDVNLSGDLVSNSLHTVE